MVYEINITVDRLGENFQKIKRKLRLKDRLKLLFCKKIEITVEKVDYLPMCRCWIASSDERTRFIERKDD